MPIVKYAILSILMLLFNLHHLYSQQDHGKKMLSYYKESVYVELAEPYATVYKLGKVYDKGMYGLSINYIDTLAKQPGTTEGFYTGKRTQLSQSGNKYYLKLDKTGSKTNRPIELNLSDNIEKDYLEINKAYWMDAFVNLSTEINSQFSIQHYSFRGYNHFDMGNQQLLPYEQFKILADKKINELRDSLVFKHSNYTSITNEVLDNFRTIDYGFLKERIEKLGKTPDGFDYFNVIIKKVSSEKPEWFYKLAEDIPSNKELMFASVYGSSVVKKLKAVETDSPVKKEFLKYKRKDRRFTFEAIGISIMGAALLAFALLSFI